MSRHDPSTVSDPDSAPDGLSQLIDASLAPAPKGELGAVKAALRQLALRLGRPHARNQQDIDRELLRAIQEIQSQVDELASSLQAMRSGIGEGEARVKEIGEQLARHTLEQGAWTTELAERVGTLERRQARAEALVATDAPLDGSPGFRLEIFEAGPAGTVVGFRAPPEQLPGSDGVYVGFEDYFRGPEELIRDRQRAYLPLVAGHGPVLDVGCGRGEFLDLLGQVGITARGIDSDAAMVVHCRGKGLPNVERADAVGCLEGLDDASLGTVFASHVIEHLPYEQLLRFLTLSLRKLKPGGLLVMETINPHAPQALKHFWLDPTHRHPLFPEVVVALCRLTGYASAYIWHPGGSGDPGRDRLHLSDYSVVARPVDADA